ncbi:MAG TPA: C40 family peptidase [Sphingobacteriaceae bacterium]
MKRTFAFCRLSAIPLRAEPSDRSEMVSQLLFGDHVEILEREEKWCRVRMDYDDYEGWLDPKQLAEISEAEYREFGNSTDILGLQPCHRARHEQTGEALHLMPGSTLPGYRHPVFGAGEIRLRLEGEALKQRRESFDREVEAVSRFYLNAPYLWGGKTPFGIDCSGLTQIVYKQFGIRLQRDASQQALQGELVAFLQEARTGDLAFFDNDEGRITHVGIMIGNAEVVHASGRVRIDSIDDQGIFNRELNRYTHQLRVIKRFV